MLRAILNKCWRQHPTRHQLYSHLPPITKTIQVRRTRHAGHCRRSKGELISDVLLRTPACDQAKAGRPARTYIQQPCEDTGCSTEHLPEAMNDREKWRERVRDIRFQVARHLTVLCGSSILRHRQKHLQLSNCVSRYQNISKLFKLPYLCVVALKGMKWITQKDVRFTAVYIYGNTDITITGNLLDLLDAFIESVTIYSVGEAPCSDFMGYITETICKYICNYKLGI